MGFCDSHIDYRNAAAKKVPSTCRTPRFAFTLQKSRFHHHRCHVRFRANLVSSKPAVVLESHSLVDLHCEVRDLGGDQPCLLHHFPCTVEDGGGGGGCPYRVHEIHRYPSVAHEFSVEGQ